MRSDATTVSEWIESLTANETWLVYKILIAREAIDKYLHFISSFSLAKRKYPPMTNDFNKTILELRGEIRKMKKVISESKADLIKGHKND